MFITTPDHEDVTHQDPASAAANTDGSTEATKLTPQELEDKAVSAFDAGLKEATDGAPPAEEQEDDGTDDGVDDEGNPIPKAAAKPGGKPAAPAKPGEGGTTQPSATPENPNGVPTPDEEVEKEIADKGLKGKSADRFRELAGFQKLNAPLVDGLKELGVEAPEHFEQLREVAEDGMAFRQVMQRSQASEDQFGRAFGYLAAVNSKDPVLMRQAYDAMATEQKWLAEQLGIKAQDYDPLDADPELKKRVLDGETPRDVAERIVAANAQARLATERAAPKPKTQAELEQEGVQAVAAVAAELRAADPDYEAKLPAMAAGVAIIRANLPPEKWAGAIKELHAKTPKPVAARQPAPARAPIRPSGTGAGGAGMQQKPASDMDAFEMGLAQANAQRG